MSKLSHCGYWFNPIEEYVLGCDSLHSVEFKSQVLYIGLCPICRDERRGWQGIRHDGTESDDIKGIKPRNYRAWDERIRTHLEIVDKNGTMSVMTQCHYEGKYSDGMKLQRVR